MSTATATKCNLCKKQCDHKFLSPGIGIVCLECSYDCADAHNQLRQYGIPAGIEGMTKEPTKEP